MSWMEERFDRRYLRKGSGTLQALARQIAEMQAEVTASQHRIGRLTLPALVLGGTNTQTLTFGKPMPSANYEVYIAVEAILGTGSAAVTAQTANGVTIRTQASGIITAGAALLVIAWNAS